MKTLYLHIGTPKTATTAIQRFCYDNREVLEKNGYYYPMFDYTIPNVQKYRNGNFLICRLYDEKRNRLTEQENEIHTDGMNKLLGYFEQYDKVILSDEGIWNRVKYEPNNCWQNIKEQLIEKGIVVKVIVYLRRQDEFIFSWWNQQIKEGVSGYSGLSGITWQEMTKTTPYIKLNYYDILNQISEYIGKENIIVRVFDKRLFVGGTIHTDFLNAIDLEYTGDYKVITAMHNPSLTKNNAYIKRIMNTLPNIDKTNDEYFRKILTSMSQEDTEDKGYSMFSYEDTLSFMQAYHDGNCNISKEYLGKEGELFDLTYNSQEKWTVNNEQIYSDIIQFFGTTTLYLLQENAILKNHVNNIRFKIKHPLKAVSKKIKEKYKK